MKPQTIIIMLMLFSGEEGFRSLDSCFKSILADGLKSQKYDLEAKGSIYFIF